MNTRIDTLNWAKENKSEWSYLIVLKNVVNDLLIEGSPLTVQELQTILHDAGHTVGIMALRDVVLRLVNQGKVEIDMGSPYNIYSLE